MVKGEEIFGPPVWPLAWQPPRLSLLRWLYLTAAWTAAAAIVWYVIFGSWQQKLAALVTAVLLDLVQLGGLFVAKRLQWRRSVAGKLGGCYECATVWASRKEFVRAHRHNERKSVQWWRWRRLPNFCPFCMHDL